MMTEEKRIEWLLKLQELTNEREQSDACIDSAEQEGRRRSQHPEQLTDEQIQQILADDEMRQLVKQLAFTKRAFKHEELKNDTLDVDAEWEKFAASHSEELEILDEGDYKPRFVLYLATHKIAASFIGVLLASGIALAAIHIVHQYQKPETPQPTDTIAVSPQRSTLNALPEETDTLAVEPRIFDNVPLDTMLFEMADYYHVSVKFERETVRLLRFHFVWKRTDDLDRLVEKLNNFEAVNIFRESEYLIVR